MKKKIRVGILFGGKSVEHEVSLQSAKNVYNALDKNKYEAVLIGIDKQGRWHLNSGAQFLLNADSPKLVKLNQSAKELSLMPGSQKHQLIEAKTNSPLPKIDVVFPVMHGGMGEDGTMQGLLKLLDVPFVGAGVLGSAVGMDKDVMKRLLKEAGIPVAKFLIFENKNVRFSQVKRVLGLPLFVKPANTGSSVGVSKVNNQSEFNKAIKDAFKYDRKIIIEQFIKGRELEVSVLGNMHPGASLPGEVIPHHEFYSYAAKYIDENGAALEVPAKVSKSTLKQIQDLAVKAFKVLNCEGMARADFFLTPAGKLYLNEINTIPGFTKISMYPKLWAYSGLPQKELITRLIDLAIERYKQEKKLKTSYEF